MAAAKAARRNNFTNELHLPNDPFQDPRIGRRTGVPLNIKARKDSHGFDNIDDYFPDSDPEEENVVPATQSSAQDCIVGRRTGVPLTIIARKDSHGFDNIDDYFPDSEPKQQNVVANGKSSAQDTIIERKAVNVNPTKDAEVFDNADDELANSGATNSKDLSPGEVEPADTPEENGESPNDTGTAIKNPASREPTPQLKGVIKKRLSFTNAKPLDESEKTQADCRDSPSHKNTDPTSEEIVESEIEIDVVDLSNDSNLIVEENDNSSSLAVTSKEKDTKQLQHDRNTKNRVDEDGKQQQQRGRKRNAKNCIDENDKQQKQQRGHERNAKNRVDEEDEVIDVEEIEEDTFLTIGNNTMQIAKSSAAVGKSPVSSFIMSESFVLEGTRHKSMSPEFGASSDSQTEPDARAKKSKIPVRQKRLTNTKPAQQRATRGRKKKAAEEPQIVDTEEADADEKEDDKQRNRKEQIFSTRGRKEAAGKGKPVESEAVEVQNGGTDEKEGRRATRLPNKRQQSKSARKGERKVTVSDQGDEGDESSAVGIEHGKKNAEGRKNTQKQNRITRGRKQKSDTENMGDGAAEVINVDNDGKKLSVHRTTPKEGVEDENKADRSEQPVECKITEISGRKTRAQRKKEKEIEEKGEGKDIEVVVDDLKIEDVESENLGSLETEKEIEKSERESRAKRKEKTKKNKENDGVENERNLTQAHSKSGGRKSQSFGRDKTLGEGDVQDLTEEVEDVSKVRGGLRGERGKPKVTEGREHDAEHEEKKDALDAIEDLADGQASSSSEHVSVTNITNVSSNASSGSESTKKAITGTRRKRRKRPRILPPYAAKRLPSKGYNSKSSSAINSHDSMSETDAKKRRLQVEGNQTSIVEENSSRKGAVTNPRISGTAKRPGRTSEVAMKSVAKSHEKESPKRGRGVSGITVENANNDNVIDDAVSVAADDASVADSVQEATGVADNSRESVLLHRTDTMTPAQPVTALKSILKSGGSLGRAATVSRKRGKTPDKSHSGGSDADDESVLPAKQPNRKRLSTVSFASTPLVQGSSSAPANRPSPGLSFVSKCSSYQSIDETFTPGSVRTVRSSGGSSGSSSAAESAINPEEEVTITSDARQPQDEQNTRRSKRTIVPPLQYWKNERIDYERRKSGGWCIKGIIKNPTPTPQHRRKPRQTKKSVVRTQNNENAGDFSEEELVNQDLEGFQEITNPKGMVLHAENNEEVEMDIFHTPAMLNFTSPSGKPAQGDDPLIVHKFISQPLFGGGQVILRPEAEKGRQVVRNDTMVFYVIKGTVMVTVHQCSTVLHSGSTFFVPQGNSYNIKNLKKTDAKLMFVQIKG